MTIYIYIYIYIHTYIHTHIDTYTHVLLIIIINNIIAIAIAINMKEPISFVFADRATVPGFLGIQDSSKGGCSGNRV